VHEPACIHRDFDLLLRTVRDFNTPDVDRLMVNDREQYDTIVSYMELISPAMVSKVELFHKSESVFDYYQIDKRLEKALNTKVWLKCGGYLIIEKTEALTVIDVNTGKFTGSKNLEDTVFRTNISAAMAIAKQIRLRDIGGIIIIDFIDMKDRKHKESLINTLKAELKKDRSKTVVMGITSLGLVEMTRKKVGIK
jgi:ribonuclease G